MYTVHAPEKLPIACTDINVRIFLAGTIDMGNSVDWQSKVEDALINRPGYIFNPRRKDWDGSWEQRISNPQFKEQVTWELDAMELSTIILMHFETTSRSPITLLELGLWARHAKPMIVSCPDGFWRKGNVEVVCDRYKIPLLHDGVDELIQVMTRSR